MNQSKSLSHPNETYRTAVRAALHSAGIASPEPETLDDLADRIRHGQHFQMLGRMTVALAHELNNLFTVVLGYSQLLRAQFPAETAEHEPLEEIIHGSERIAALGAALAELGQPRPGMSSSVDLNAVVAGLDGFLRLLARRPITLTTTFEPRLAAIWADPGQVQQVLLNLVGNACDALPHGGRITVATANTSIALPPEGEEGFLPAGPYAMLVVGDTGVGMDDQTRSRLFEPFFSTKQPAKGAGLGLAVVKTIVESAGGGMQIWSAPDKGTTVRLFFPTSREPPAAPGEAAAAAPTPALPTVLVVDNQDGLLDIARHTLEAEGYQVLTAPDPNVALRLGREHPGPIHLLLTDINMPEMNGLELAKRFEILRPGIAILYTSGYPVEFFADDGIFIPEDRFLKKPFDLAGLKEKVRKMLG